MSDHCRPCSRVVWGHNLSDFDGWLNGTGLTYFWALCEGCGRHLLNNNGDKLCGLPPYPDPSGWGHLSAGCPECWRRAP